VTSGTEENSDFNYVLTKSSTVSFHSYSNSFKIRMCYRPPSKLRFSEVVENYGYPNEEDAKFEIIALRNAYEFNCGKNWTYN